MTSQSRRTQLPDSLLWTRSEGSNNLRPPQKLQWAQYSIRKTSFKTSRNLSAELRNDLLLVRGPATAGRPERILLHSLFLYRSSDISFVPALDDLRARRHTKNEWITTWFPNDYPATPRPLLWRREDHRRERTMALGKYDTTRCTAPLPGRRGLHLALYDYGQRPGFRVMDPRESWRSSDCGNHRCGHHRPKTSQPNSSSF